MTSTELSKGERTRQTVIDAAHQLFAEKGFAGTSMRAIAERAGLALGGIYNHFHTKEAIFSEVLISKHPFHQVFPLLLAAPGDSITEFVPSAARNMLAELGRRPDFLKLMFVEIVEFKGSHLPKMVKFIYPQVLPLVERFRARKGELRDIDTIIFFRSFLGLFFSFYMTEFLMSGLPESFQSAHALDSFVEIFLHGVLAPKENG